MEAEDLLKIKNWEEIDADLARRLQFDNQQEKQLEGFSNSSIYNDKITIGPSTSTTAISNNQGETFSLLQDRRLQEQYYKNLDENRQNEYVGKFLNYYSLKKLLTH